MKTHEVMTINMVTQRIAHGSSVLRSPLTPMYRTGNLEYGTQPN
jgi:hypothetical protein